MKFGFGHGWNKRANQQWRFSLADEVVEFAEKNAPQRGGGGGFGGGGLGGGFGGGGTSDLDTIASLEKQIKTIKDRMEFVKTTLDKTQYERFN